MNYYQVHKNKTAKRIKRNRKFDPRVPLMAMSAAMSAVQFNILISQPMGKAEKAKQVFNVVTSAAGAIMNIERDYRLHQFKITGKYGRGTINKRIVTPTL